METNNTRQLYLVEPRRPMRRVQSIGDGTYAIVPTVQSPLITHTPVYSQPVLLHQLPQTPSTPGLQSHRFSPYQPSARSRSNSDNSPRILMMNAVVPSATPVPTFAILTNRRSQPVGNTDSHVLNSVTPPPTTAEEAPVNSSSFANSPPKNVVCGNCGVETQQADTCMRCRKILFPNPVFVKAGHRSRQTSPGTTGTTKPKNNGLPSSSFYNGEDSADTSDLMRYLKNANCGITVRRVPRNPLRKRTKAKSEAVCITISSDEDEDASSSQETPTATPSTSSSASPILKSCPSILSVGETPTKRLKQDTPEKSTVATPSTSSTRLTFAYPVGALTTPSPPPASKPPVLTDENVSKMTLNLKIDCIRLGQMKLFPKSICRISHQNITMTANCPSIDTDVILTVPWEGVVNCDVCEDLREPCIFIVLNPSFLPRLREMLRMEKGKFPYYDPGGTDDERYFIFYLNSDQMAKNVQSSFDLLWKKIDLIRRKLKRPMSFQQKITFTVSESRQSAAAAYLEAAGEGGSQKIPPALPLDPAAHLGATTSASTAQSPGHVVTQNHMNDTDDVTDPGDQDDLKLMFSGPRIKLFVYPPPPATGGISVTNEDQFCLNKGEFLNDVIIDFYLNYILNQLLSTYNRNRTHIFSCFFYERLMQKPARKSKELSTAEQRHNQVRKWTRNVDIFSKDFIFVPINEASHWYLAVICFPSLTGDEIFKPQPKTTMQSKGKTVLKKQTTKPDLPASMQYLASYGINESEDDKKSSEVESVQTSKVGEVSIDRSSPDDKTTGTSKAEERMPSIGATSEVSGSGVEGEKVPRDTTARTHDKDGNKTANCDLGPVAAGDKSKGCESEKVKSERDSASEVIVLDDSFDVNDAKGQKLQTKAPQSGLTKDNKRNLITITLPRFSRTRTSNCENGTTSASNRCSKIHPSSHPSGYKGSQGSKTPANTLRDICKENPTELETVTLDGDTDKSRLCERETAAGPDVGIVEPESINRDTTGQSDVCKHEVVTSPDIEGLEPESINHDMSGQSDVCKPDTMAARNIGGLVPESVNHGSPKPNAVHQQTPPSIVGELSAPLAEDNASTELDRGENCRAGNEKYSIVNTVTESSITDNGNNPKSWGVSFSNDPASPCDAAERMEEEQNQSIVNVAEPVTVPLPTHLARNSMYEISLVTDGPAFTLPKDLRDKCTISPSKRLEVRVARIEIEKSVDFEHRTASSVRDTNPEKTVNSEPCTNSVMHGKNSENIPSEVLSHPTDVELRDETKEHDNVRQIEKKNDFEPCTDALVHDETTEQTKCQISATDNEACVKTLQIDMQAVHPTSENTVHVEHCDNAAKLNKSEKGQTATVHATSENTVHVEHCDNAAKLDKSEKGQTATIEKPSGDISEECLNKSPNFEQYADAMALGAGGASLQTKEVTCCAAKRNVATEPEHSCVIEHDMCTEPEQSCERMPGVASDRERSCTTERVTASKPGITCSEKRDVTTDPERLTSPSRSGDEAIVLSSDFSDTEEKKQTEILKAFPVKRQEKDSSSETSTGNTGTKKASETQTKPDCPAKERTSQVQEKPSGPTSSEAKVFKRPCIVVFDSLRGPSRSKTATNLREYLCMEWITRKYTTHGAKIFNKDTIKMSSAIVPQQDNYSDCGIFLLHYVEKFFSNPLMNFSTPIRDLENWFNPEECKHKRDDIKTIINNLHEDWVARNTN